VTLPPGKDSTLYYNQAQEGYRITLGIVAYRFSLVLSQETLNIFPDGIISVYLCNTQRQGQLSARVRSGLRIEAGYFGFPSPTMRPTNEEQNQHRCHHTPCFT
jgi:hypothetical protein